MAEEGRGRYLFAVTRGLSEGALGGVSGLRSHPVEVVECHGLQAVVGTVDLEEFGEEAVTRNLEDLAWLEEVARTHNDVVFAVASRATVAPMRLVTICSDDDSVRRRVEDLHEALEAALDRVEGRQEWSVKAYAAPEPAPASAVAEAPSASSGAEGLAYLQRKKAAAEQRRSAGEQSARVADELHHRLAGASVAGRLLAPQDPRLTGRSDPMILNAAYLVSVEDADSFRELASEVAREHPSVVVEVEGPWPPYSFATLE